MKKILFAITGLVLAGLISLAPHTAEAAGAYPKNKPREQSWSFAGPFGTWDYGQLQRGFKVYREVCASCHSMNLIRFRDLAGIGFTEEQIKALAAEYEVTDGPNIDGEMFERPAVATDAIPAPYANDNEAAAVNNGAVPPDFSLLAKARAVERGFPTFVFDVFTLYAENGPDYIYSLLTGYPEETPEGVDLPEGVAYNPYFIAGEGLAMAQPLWGDDVEYDDGTEATISQQSKDVSAFMMWAAEPYLVDRKQMGFKVIVFLLLFAGLLYLTKKQVFRDLKSA